MFSIWSRQRSLLRRLKADRSGASVMEFAIIGVPLIYMMMFLIELVIIGGAQVVLDATVDTASRSVFTGTAQEGGLTTNNLKAAICAETGPLLTCDDDRMVMEFKVFNDFTSVATQNPFDADKNFVAVQSDFANSALASADGDTIVVMRVYYRWPLITPFLGFLSRPSPEWLAVSRHRERILMSTTAFRVEPYNVGSGT